jgi:hypothetical protein
MVMGVHHGKRFDGVKNLHSGGIGDEITVIKKSHFFTSGILC